MELTKDIPLPLEVYPSKAPVLASGVVVKFAAKGRRPGGNRKETGVPGPPGSVGPGTVKKMRREFFEHDTRKTKANKMKWTGGAMEDKSMVVKGGGGGAPGNSPPVVGGEKQMNSKARRAAKFREMKVLQRIMLSKEVNIAQLLPTLTPSVSSGCCHCKCSGTHDSTDTGPQRQQQSIECSSELVVEREVVNSCSVR